MKPKTPIHRPPADAAARQAVKPVICYPVDSLQPPDLAAYHAARKGWRKEREVLVPPRETVEVAFVADNPGDWMLHCHVTDHQVSGLMTLIRVA